MAITHGDTRTCALDMVHLGGQARSDAYEAYMMHTHTGSATLGAQEIR